MTLKTASAPEETLNCDVFHGGKTNPYLMLYGTDTPDRRQ